MILLQKTYDQAMNEWAALEQSDVPIFFVGAATCGCAAGAGEVIGRLRRELSERNLDAQIIEVGCMGPCFMEPLLIVHKPGSPRVLYGQVTADHASEILEKHVLGDDPCAKYALGTLADAPLDGIAPFVDHPLMKHQVRRVLRNCGLIDPENINHYFARDGYRGLIKALEMGSDKSLEVVKNSGLRGRGGAGFPTWRKWEFCRNVESSTKYLICNADEGDPGAFMNRSLIEGDPHAVLEGMLIAGYTLGATDGYIYCRAEYPLAIKRLQIALKQMEEHGMLGENIL
jgi:(2Fe-2S) ferredoxin